MERGQQRDTVPGVKPQGPRLPLPEPCPQGPARDSLSAPAGSCDDTCGVLPTRDPVPRVLLGTVHMGTLRLAPNSQGKAGVQA